MPIVPRNHHTKYGLNTTQDNGVTNVGSSIKNQVLTYQFGTNILRMSPIWGTTGERYADVIQYRTNPNDF